MPIYMDRHDVSEAVTAEIVAQIHQEDLKIQHNYGCRGLTYWFDDARKTAFCLVEAPNENAIVEMHQHAHGEVPHQIIEVEASIVESFLGRIEDPKKAQNTQLNIINDPAFRIIMFISLDYSFYKNYDPLLFGSIFHRLKQKFTEILKLYEGNIVQQNEHEFLISFKSVTKAVLCSLKVKEAFAKIKTENQGIISMKIGLNAGIPVTEKKEIFEDTIRLAKYLKYISSAEIIVSTEVKDLYKSENLNKFFESKELFALTIQEADFIENLMGFVEREWQNANLQVDDFHRNLGLSKSNLYRKMMLLTDKSPNTFLLDYRLQMSLALLKKNRSSISEVAFDSGFNSPSYFTKCFRKKYGMMPSELSTAINS